MANCNGRHPRNSASGSHTPTTATTIATLTRAVDPGTGWLISPIVAASLCIKPRGLLTTAQAAKIDALKGASPDFTAMRQLAMQFRGILRSKDIQKFDVWLNDARQSGIYAICRFAHTIQRDIDAVRNALEQRPNRRANQSSENPQARDVRSSGSRAPTRPDVASSFANRSQSLRKTHFDLFLKETEFRFNYGTPSQQLRPLKRWAKISS